MKDIRDFFETYACGMYLVKTQFGTDLLFDFPFPNRDIDSQKEDFQDLIKEFNLPILFKKVQEPINFGNNGILPQQNNRNVNKK